MLSVSDFEVWRTFCEKQNCDAKRQKVAVSFPIILFHFPINVGSGRPLHVEEAHGAAVDPEDSMVQKRITAGHLWLEIDHGSSARWHQRGLDVMRWIGEAPFAVDSIEDHPDDVE